jgi:hypothetical protein
MNQFKSSFRQDAETSTLEACAPRRLRPTRPPLQQNASAEQDGYNSRGDFANPTVFPDSHRQSTLTKFDAIPACLFVATSSIFGWLRQLSANH